MRNATDSLLAGLGAMWTNVLTFAPKLMLFLAILVVGYFISKWISQLVEVALRRLGLEHALERGGINRALSKSPYPALAILRKIIFFGLFLLTLQLAFNAFGPNPVSDILTRTVLFLPNLFVALVIVIVAAAVGKMVTGIVSSMLSRLSYGSVLGNAAGASILVIGCFAALSHLQIAPAIVNGLFYAALLVIAGSAIVAIGGGGIIPMQRQWEKTFRRIEQENQKSKAAAPAAVETETEIPINEPQLVGSRGGSRFHNEEEKHETE